MAKKDFTLKIKAEDVMYTNISTSKDGYNSARMVVKRGDKEYLSVSTEWEGDNIPSFALDLMGFMKANKVDASGVPEGQEKAYVEFLDKAIVTFRTSLT
jgi:hypothetical protein